MTRRQRELLDFLKRYIAEHDGVSPSYDEMMAALGLQSKSGVNRLITALRERGLIRMVPNLARSITVVADSEPDPDALSPLLENALHRYCSETRLSRRDVITEALGEYFKRRSA